MKCLFFISLLAVAAASTVNLPLKKLLANPKLFAAAFAHADNEAVNRMIAVVDQLLEEGEGARTFAIDNHATATDTHNADITSLSEAESALATASGNADVASTKRDNLVAKEQGDRDSLSAAVNVLGAAEDLEAETSAHLTSTTERVAEEKESFESIIELLESTSAGADRRLLSNNEADPGAVGIVVEKVQALLATGATELADSTSAHEAATAALATAVANEEAARTLHTATAGQLAAAKKSVLDLTAIKKTKNAERNAAVEAESDSALALANALNFHDSEILRINGEKGTLEEVRELLVGINGE